MHSFNLFNKNDSGWGTKLHNWVKSMPIIKTFQSRRRPNQIAGSFDEFKSSMLNAPINGCNGANLFDSFPFCGFSHQFHYLIPYSTLFPVFVFRISVRFCVVQFINFLLFLKLILVADLLYSVIGALQMVVRNSLGYAICNESMNASIFNLTLMCNVQCARSTNIQQLSRTK